MSVTIRLAKFGKRHAPSFRVVVTQTKTKRNGKFLEILGFYNPIDPKSKLTINKDGYDKWVGKGAIVTAAVKSLLDGTFKYADYNPKAQKEAADKAAAENAKEAAESAAAESAKKSAESAKEAVESEAAESAKVEDTPSEETAEETAGEVPTE